MTSWGVLSFSSPTMIVTLTYTHITCNDILSNTVHWILTEEDLARNGDLSVTTAVNK